MRTFSRAYVALFAIVPIVCAAVMLWAVPKAEAETEIHQCTGTWTVVVGGLNNNDSTGFLNANQRVGYNSYDTRAGINELNRLARDHRSFCPGDHVKIVGHSGGAAVVHQWLSENGQTFGNVNAVLLADPKRPAGPGGQGFAGTDFPFNQINNGLAGTNANYGGVPTLSICNASDHICNSAADWNGYLFGGSHGNYDFNTADYGNWGNGVIFNADK